MNFFTVVFHFIAVAIAAYSFPVDVSILGIRINHTKLENAAKQLAPTAIVEHHGDAALSEGRICFSPEDTKDLVIQFASDSEMSRGVVSSFRLVKTQSNHSYLNCNRVFDSKVKLSRLNLPGKISLGMSQAEIEGKLGKLQTGNIDENLAFSITKCSPVKKCSYCRGYNFNFENDKLSELSYSGAFSDCSG